jgi:acyl-phosphate glycerol 3-phosphate acyltransferase
MTGPAAIALTALLAYLIGAIPFGYLVARWHDVDIFQHGSGNIGATNVGRVLGKRLGILVFVLDFAKGALPTAAARWAEQAQNPGTQTDVLPVVAGLAAFVGHMFPVYLRFRGGKGVATGAGVVTVLLTLPALAGLLVWIAVVSASRYVSLASLAAVLALCAVHLLVDASEPPEKRHVILTGFCLVAAGLVFARHRANIARLLQGNENRIPESGTMLTFMKTIHVLALGLWFGSVAFFTFFVGLSLFATFDAATTLDKDARPYWLPVPQQLNQKALQNTRFPDPLRKEQGSRIFGMAVGPMFVPYFTLQAICGVLALGTAVGWSRSYAGRVHRLRTWLLLIALATVVISFWLDHEVNVRRDVRAETSDAVLLALPTVSDSLIRAADSAREDFSRWHGYSILVNLVTLVLVTVATALAAQLPAAEVPNPNTETKTERPNQHEP